MRIGNKVIVGAGLASFGIAMFWTARDSQATSYVTLVAQEVVLGTGLGPVAGGTAAAGFVLVAVALPGRPSVDARQARVANDTQPLDTT